jgi:hypothetical protein
VLRLVPNLVAPGVYVGAAEQAAEEAGAVGRVSAVSADASRPMLMAAAGTERLRMGRFQCRIVEECIGL